VREEVVKKIVWEKFKPHFIIKKEAEGICFYRGVEKDVRIDFLLIDHQKDLVFGVECKTHLERVKQTRQAFDQCMSYLNTRFQVDGEGRIPDAVFLASPSYSKRFEDRCKKLALLVLPSSLGVLDFESDNIELRMCTNTRLWSRDSGYHANTDGIVRAHVGSQRMKRTV